MSKRYYLIIILALLMAGKSFARFFPSDADSIDDENKISTEFFNDVASYQYPLYWDNSWEATRNGFRTRVGSLNANYFLFNEELKLQTDPDANVSLRFDYSHYSDHIYENVHKELRLQFGRAKGIYSGFLFEPQGKKKWIDIGAFLGIGFGKTNCLEAYYYSVDHYYNTKEESGVGFYSRKPWQAGIRSHIHVSDSIDLNLSGSFTHPLHWQRENMRQTYEFHDKDLELRVNFHLEDDKKIELYHQSEIKSEKHLNWQDSNRTEIYDSIGLHRIFNNTRIGYIKFLESEENYSIYLSQLSRVADIDRFHVDPTIVSNSEQDIFDIKRNEQILHGTFRQNYFNSDHFFYYGFVLSNVQLTREYKDNRSAQELKFRFNWERMFTKNASLIIGTNWDMDKIVSHFPYSKKPFEPWDGGSALIRYYF